MPNESKSHLASFWFFEGYSAGFGCVFWVPSTACRGPRFSEQSQYGARLGRCLVIAGRERFGAGDGNRPPRPRSAVAVIANQARLAAPLHPCPRLAPMVLPSVIRGLFWRWRHGSVCRLAVLIFSVGSNQGGHPAQWDAVFPSESLPLCFRWPDSGLAFVAAAVTVVHVSTSGSKPAL